MRVLSVGRFVLECPKSCCGRIWQLYRWLSRLVAWAASRVRAGPPGAALPGRPTAAGETAGRPRQNSREPPGTELGSLACWARPLASRPARPDQCGSSNLNRLRGPTFARRVPVTWRRRAHPHSHPDTWPTVGGAHLRTEGATSYKTTAVTNSLRAYTISSA